MVKTRIRKHANGYYARRHFDGTLGVPKMTFYLNTNGTWNDEKLTSDCFFPTRELCESFLRLRENYEDANHKITELEFTLSLYRPLDIKKIIGDQEQE